MSHAVGRRLVTVQTPLSACREAPDGASCRDVYKELKNPYYLEDQDGLTQTSGWVDAWTSQPSVYAVAARNTDDVVTAVNFAHANDLRLVIKGGGDSYLGTSNAPDSLLVWLRATNAIRLHDAFVAGLVQSGGFGSYSKSYGTAAASSLEAESVTVHFNRNPLSLRKTEVKMGVAAASTPRAK